MKRDIIQIFILILFSTFCCLGQSNTWMTLTPLHSTRADVEKLFGKPAKEPCAYGCVYKTPNDNIRVFYVSRKCDADGWNVPAGTVLRTTLYSAEMRGKSFAELKLDKNKFSHTIDDAFFGTWTNPEEGVQFSFDNIDKIFGSISYLPKQSDNNLRCNGFPPYRPEGAHFTMEKEPFYNPALGKKESLNRIFAASDNFFLTSLDEYFKTNYKAYAVIYFDDKLSLKEYQNRLTKLKQFIFKVRKYSPEHLIFIEGGMREESDIEFYLLPKEWQPPAPDPTLPSPQFMKKQAK